MAPGRLDFAQRLPPIEACLASCLSAAAKERAATDLALQGALAESAAEIAAKAEEAAACVAAAAEVLLPQVREAAALSPEALSRLNSAVVACEEAFGAHGGKSDKVPEPLLAAAPGSKLYPGLAKKVEALCARSQQQLEQRCREGLSERLLQGGRHAALDAARKEGEDSRASAVQEACRCHAEALAQSDHLPLLETLPLQDGKSLRLLSWNVLELPSKGAETPVLDGITVYCEQLQKAVGRKGSEERQVLQSAFQNDVVISSHYDLVLAELQSALAPDEGEPAVAALLQELSSEFLQRLRHECEQQQWHICAFPNDSVAPGKCESITAVVSRQAFEEQRAVEVQEGKKARRFAAVRLADAWLVSCHVPHEAPPKKKGEPSDGNVATACQAVRCVRTELGEGCLVLGGDFNADVRAVAAALGEGALVLAPDGATAFDETKPIDGFLRLL